MKNRLLLFLLVLALLFTFPVGSHATQFNNLVVYGDSLSDNGNFGRWTDGPIWVEILASYLGADLYDFAYGGATTSYDNPEAGIGWSGLQWQVENHVPPTYDALFSVWAGGNDFLQARPPDMAAFNVGLALDELYADGARDFLVGNLPDIGSTPAFLGYGAASDWTLGFNAVLEDVLSGFECLHADVNLYRLDAYGLFSGFTPGTQDWLDLFWYDGFHPSSVGHQLIADAAYNQVAPVPEPTTILLLGTGLLGLAGFRREKREG